MLNRPAERLFFAAECKVMRVSHPTVSVHAIGTGPGTRSAYIPMQCVRFHALRDLVAGGPDIVCRVTDWPFYGSTQVQSTKLKRTPRTAAAGGESPSGESCIHFQRGESALRVPQRNWLRTDGFCLRTEVPGTRETMRVVTTWY